MRSSNYWLSPCYALVLHVKVDNFDRIVHQSNKHKVVFDNHALRSSSQWHDVQRCFRTTHIPHFNYALLVQHSCKHEVTLGSERQVLSEVKLVKVTGSASINFMFYLTSHWRPAALWCFRLFRESCELLARQNVPSEQLRIRGRYDNHCVFVNCNMIDRHSCVCFLVTPQGLASADFEALDQLRGTANCVLLAQCQVSGVTLP